MFCLLLSRLIHDNRIWPQRVIHIVIKAELRPPHMFLWHFIPSPNSNFRMFDISFYLLFSFLELSSVEIYINRNKHVPLFVQSLIMH